MSKTSEHTFGEKYSKGRGLTEYLQTIPGYAPGNPDLLAINISVLLDSIEIENSTASSRLSILQNVRSERFEMYYGNAGLRMRCSQIRDYLASLPEGKKSNDFKKVQKIVQQIRGVNYVKKKKQGSRGEKKIISSSERSFGAILGYCKEVLELIKTIPAYTPGNINLTIANFTLYLAEVELKNSEAAEKFYSLEDARTSRRELYDQLKDRIQKVKSSLASQFGKNSSEYKDIVKY